jgi:hypothetical protein
MWLAKGHFIGQLFEGGKIELNLLRQIVRVQIETAMTTNFTDVPDPVAPAVYIECERVNTSTTPVVRAVASGCSMFPVD